jgi:hypothetical protein
VTIAGSSATIATGKPETIAIGMNVTAMSVMTVTVKKGTRIGAIGRALLPVVEKMIVAPGRLRLGGILKKKGLQGTMIDGEAMMTGEVLTLIMTVAGTTAGTIAAAMKRTTDTRKGLPDTMGTAGGVEGGCRVVMVLGPSKKKGTERATDPPDGRSLLAFISFLCLLFSRVSSVELLPC